MKQNKIINDFMPVTKEELSERGIEELDFVFANIPFKAYRYETNDISNNKPLIIYIHGGSYFAGSAKGYENIVKYLCKHTNSVVYNVEYSLAPEHPFPTAYNQIKYLIENLILEDKEFYNKKVILGSLLELNNLILNDDCTPIEAINKSTK